MGLREATGFFLSGTLPFDKYDKLTKFCHTGPNLRAVEMFHYLAVGFIDV